jgi:hypothetical protein
MNKPIPIMGVPEIYEHYERRIAKQWYYNAAKKGIIKAFRSGNRILINADSVDEYLRNNTLTDEQPASVGGIRALS